MIQRRGHRLAVVQLQGIADTSAFYNPPPPVVSAPPGATAPAQPLLCAIAPWVAAASAFLTIAAIWERFKR